MSIISQTEHRTAKGRLVVVLIYLTLIIGGATMVYPFLITLTGSVCNTYDYNRRSVLPRFLWSREDRFMRALCTYFPPTHRGSIQQLRSYFADFPKDWQVWPQIGDDYANSDAWARKQLAELNNPARRRCIAAAAQDYGEFMAHWDLRETVLAYNKQYVPSFLRERYHGSLQRFNKAWQMSLDDFSKFIDDEWSGEPIDQRNYVPIDDKRYADLLAFRQAYRENRYNRYLTSTKSAASYLRPASLRYVWEEKYAPAAVADSAQAISELPFPAPRDTPAPVLRAWMEYVKNDLPLRHVRITLTEARKRQFRDFLIRRFRDVATFDRIADRPIRSWNEIPLTAVCPPGILAKAWMGYVVECVPPEEWIIRDTLPDKAFQDFALARHGSLKGVNRAYGLKLHCVEQLRIPFKEAFLDTFAKAELPITLDGMSSNYSIVCDYLFHRGRAVRNTIILVALALLVTLTVNPLAGYALSRFRFRGAEKVIIFCLATMAFPAAVAAIPGFLLLRDLHMLNTFAALVLPSAANGMTIFLLKGFFDSLPRELYEAATIDGAPEWRVFWQVSLPLIKPILAVSMLNAFIAAYNGWEWAIIVCQDPRMWTIAVWTYQFYQIAGQQGSVLAAFVLNSIPVMLVFLMCQKVILRGIILPQMK